MPGAVQAEQAIMQWRRNHMPLNRCTVSSDAYGSLPVFDDHGKLVSYEVRLCLYTIPLGSSSAGSGVSWATRTVMTFGSIQVVI